MLLRASARLLATSAPARIARRPLELQPPFEAILADISAGGSLSRKLGAAPDPDAVPGGKSRREAFRELDDAERRVAERQKEGNRVPVLAEEGIRVAGQDASQAAEGDKPGLLGLAERLKKEGAGSAVGKEGGQGGGDAAGGEKPAGGRGDRADKADEDERIGLLAVGMKQTIEVVVKKGRI